MTSAILPVSSKSSSVAAIGEQKQNSSLKLVKKVTSGLLATYTQINADYYERKYERRLSKYRPGAPLVTPSGTPCQGNYGRIVSSQKKPDAVIKLQSPHRRNPREIESCARAAKTECHLHTQLSKEEAPHIPFVYDSFSSEGKRYALVMEKTGPDLYETYLNPKNPRRKIPTLNEIESIGKKLLETFLFIHRKNIAHFDLKPENCTLDHLLDFGTSEVVPPEGIIKLKYTRYYRPPEVVLQIPFGVKADMWSLGCTLFELYTSRPFIEIDDNKANPLQADIDMLNAYHRRLHLKEVPPHMASRSKRILQLFQQTDSLTSVLKKGTTSYRTLPLIEALYTARNGVIDEKLKQFVDLLTQLLQFDPEQRITASEAINHPFFTAETSCDSSFKIDVIGEKNIAFQMVDANNKVLKIIDLSRSHPGLCYHIRKSKEPYRFEFFRPEKPDAVLGSCNYNPEDGEIIAIDTKAFSVRSSMEDTSSTASSSSASPPLEKVSRKRKLD